jgi:hypothetical protein
VPGTTDNFNITEGTGTSIASDYVASGLPTTVGSGHVQLVKLVSGENGGINPLLISSRNAASVEPPACNTAAVTSVAANVADVTILGANTNRLTFFVVNDSVANLFLNFGGTASLTVFAVRLEEGQLYECPIRWTGSVHGIWDAAPGGAARITEFS